MKSETTTLSWLGCGDTATEGVVVPGSGGEAHHHHHHTKMIICCAGCGRPIMDKFLLTVLDRTWHAECVRCVDCGSSLTEKCFSREDKLYCRADFFKRFGKKCSGCLEGISPSELIRKARDRVYHIKCFTCFVCRKQLSTGEELYVLTANKFVCKQDYTANKFLVEGECGGATDDDDEELDIKPPLLENNNNNNNTSNNNNNSLSSHHLDSPQPNVPTLPPPPSLHQPLTSPTHGPPIGTSPTTMLHGGLMVGGRPPTPLTGGLATSSTPTSLHEPLTDSKANLNLSSYTLGLSTTPNSDKDPTQYHDSETSDNEANAESKDPNGPGAKVPDDDKSGNKRRGPRTTIKAKQLEVLKLAFNNTPKPTRHIREQLAKETGLPMRVIQVWFQNKRSKERRMKQLTSMGMRAHLFANPRKLRGMRMSPSMEDAYQYYGDAFGYPPQGFHDFFPGQGPPPHMGFPHGLPPAMEQPLPPGGPLSDFGNLGGLGLPPPPPDTPHFVGQPPELLTQRASPDGVGGGMILPHGGGPPGSIDPQVSEGLVW